MNKVILSGTIVNFPIKWYKTKSGTKVLNNQIDVYRSGTTYADRINITAWKEHAELISNANENTVLELEGEWHVENFKDKKGNKIRRDVLVVSKVDFAKIETEAVQDTDDDDEIPNISEDDLPF